ncbi:hypothetical protein CXB51_004008 [Gossypium anomalum]|uniref:Uncharacterized protein n=1 Tax=Gossypium anomalum TaxID=47600 RepID=A0A8J5ZPU2_9ROSI|nr:hypothetical protein CXB51_004008 [Gossypium anomalum]
MAFITKILFNNILGRFIHDDFHEAVSSMTITDAFLFLMVHWVDKVGKWHRLPVILGLIYLAVRRRLHQHYNLISVGKSPSGVRVNPGDYKYRTADGSHGDPFNEGAGSQGTFFGRNIMPVDQTDKLKKPDPMVVATKLLTRTQYKDTGKQLNMIAASWIQFMIHDWVDHMENTNQQVELIAPKEVANKCPLTSLSFIPQRSFRLVLMTSKLVQRTYAHIGGNNISTLIIWKDGFCRDGSVIYGSDKKRLQKVRTLVDGKLKISEDGLLQQDEDGIPISGDIKNSWAGVSTLQALFIKEHNAICDALKKEYPALNDEELYRHARLITSAVIAKIHTIDWTVELLKTDILLAGMRINCFDCWDLNLQPLNSRYNFNVVNLSQVWILGKKFKDTFGHVGGSTLGGLVGLKKPINHGVPYTLTEEFTSVYRMHQLLPDSIHLRNINVTPGPNKSPPLLEEVPMPDLIGHKGEKTLSQIGFTRQFVSMGHQACGALELCNYPSWLRDLVAQDVDGKDRPDHVDLAALEDLTEDKEAIEVLKEVYGDNVEELDLMVGLMAEKKIKGFAISETSFIVFLLMASRRLEADRFFTSDFNEEAYTKKGFEWVNTTESLKDVLNRHYPEISKKWINSTSAFSVWDSPPNAPNPIPLYLRFPC